MNMVLIEDDDSIDTWIAIYTDAGEIGLMEYSKVHHDPERGLGLTVERAYLRRLAGVASKVPMIPEEFYQIASKLPEELRSLLVKNRTCPESLIEDLWTGNYVDGMGNPEPTAVICSAFYNNHYKMRAIYARRPDLRIHVSEYMQRMTESSLREDEDALLNSN